MIKILIVEDESIIRKGLIYTINWLEMGCIVIGDAENGEKGLEKINKLLPDVVITDIKMPRINGLEMIEKAKKKFDFETIIISSYSEFEYAKQAIHLEVFDYLLKPIDEEKLKKIIEKVKIKIKDKKIYNEIKEKIENKKENLEIININYYMYSNEQISKRILKMIEYIKENYNKKISIEDIADKLDCSSGYLSRKFREETGITFNNFVNKYKIQKSIELLNSGKYKVYEIADMLGFNNYKYFAQVFKNYMNCSPLKFINTQK
ncbi:AraC family two component transcriptional regulator [Hypnocyclicus thermotrophus]|uniref:AraC family two component transcriptional regulator n=1 Tax=Hypnocyclicus thermotrophus TaxID=1627895 RepID=A0AA46I4X0_9FUSO|nr:response regulator [Hypnocyclicus thermotrophus]TDT68010.1 AraC family two component transcriptional regulator [Hypnocyclicus thermotrophus]